MCTVALRTMYAQEHAAFAGCRLRTRPCMSTVTIPFSEWRMCPYPDVPASVRGLNRTRRRSSTQHGHGPRTSLERALRKFPPEKSGGQHAVYPEACNRQRNLTWRYPLICRRSPLLVRPTCDTCGTVHNMELALGLTSRLDISVTMSSSHQERMCKRFLGDNAAHYLPVNRPQSSNAVLYLRSQNQPE